ncbi:MAG: hypothetical protein LAT50_12140 [Ectothiorhodospiraceae bacterium]|nr:hypothetical protein [Ectothiorhodospiraceae bacterium]
MKQRLALLATALSQLLHVLLTMGGGDPKMTTSARIGRQVARGERWALIAEAIISALLFDPDHCLGAYILDRRRRMCAGGHDA